MYHIQEAWHSFIDAKCRPWSHKSNANPPGGDTKPPGPGAITHEVCCLAAELQLFKIIQALRSNT
jgi:hypothetical protein